jgi:hypothetical protein
MQSRVKSAGHDRRVRWVHTCSVIALCLGFACHGQRSDAAPAGDTPLPASAASAGFTTVLDAWLAFPSLARSSAPYSYLRARPTAERVRIKRDDLFRELDDLRWRLEGNGYTKLVAALDQWKSRLAQLAVFREPGDWSPASLMAQPLRNPPIGEVAAIGACEVPDWVEIWSADGVRRTPWRTGLTLSGLAKSDAMNVQGIKVASVVSPTGDVRRYGQAAFNKTDTALLPGARVVLPLPLGGEAFPWIRNTIAEVLAHAPSGENCSEMRLAQAGGVQ